MNREIAKVLGVDEITVRRDTAANVAPADKKASKPKGKQRHLRQMSHSLVDHKTVAPDVGEHSPAKQKKAKDNKADKAAGGEHSPPAL